MAFTLLQNIKSKKAEELGINNFPGVDIGIDPTLTYDFIVRNLSRLHANCISPIMEAFGENNIGITSAYRCMELNREVKGVENSQHIKGCAIDLVSINHPTSKIFNWAVQNLPDYYQLIWEYPEKGLFNNPNNFDPSWIHISLTDGFNPKTNSIATKMEKVHQAYIDNIELQIPVITPYRSGDYTHNISKADNNLFL